MHATDVATILRPNRHTHTGDSTLGTKNRGHIGGLHGWSSALGRRLWVQAPGRGSFHQSLLSSCIVQTWTCYTPACITLTDISQTLQTYLYVRMHRDTIWQRKQVGYRVIPQQAYTFTSRSATDIKMTKVHQCSRAILIEWVVVGLEWSLHGWPCLSVQDHRL